MSPATQKIFASTIGALGVAAGLILLAYGFSTVLTSTNAPSNRDLIDTPAASDKSIANAQPPAFRVGLAVIPGAAKLPELATIGVHSSALGLEAPTASEVPEMIQTPVAALSALDVALHPSLKYANWVPSAPIVRASSAAFDIPIVTFAATTVKPAKRPPSAAKPMAAGSDDAETARLIALNLRMESARRFVTSMCEDHQGRLWVASDNQVPEEPEGCVECFDPAAPELRQWTQFTTKDGLGDDTATAVACDREGRIWVGHTGNHGVSVFNGQQWQNYSNCAIPTGTSGVLGPLGEHVSHITICPTDGDVWIATDCGLTRYSDSKGTWAIYGLAAGEATSFAFDKQGNVYVATEHDGIAMANVAENYSVWRRATAPDQTSATIYLTTQRRLDRISA